MVAEDSITFKLGSFTNLKPLFPVVSMDENSYGSIVCPVLLSFFEPDLLTSSPVVAYSVEFIAKLSMVTSFKEFRRLPALLV